MAYIVIYRSYCCKERVKIALLTAVEGSEREQSRLGTAQAKPNARRRNRRIARRRTVSEEVMEIYQTENY